MGNIYFWGQRVLRTQRQQALKSGPPGGTPLAQDGWPWGIMKVCYVTGCTNLANRAGPQSSG